MVWDRSPLLLADENEVPMVDSLNSTAIGSTVFEPLSFGGSIYLEQLAVYS